MCVCAADGPAAADAVVQFQPPSGELHQDLLPWTVPHDLAFICKCGDEVWVLYDDLGKYWTRGMVIDLSEENVLVCFFGEQRSLQNDTCLLRQPP